MRIRINEGIDWIWDERFGYLSASSPANSRSTDLPSTFTPFCPRLDIPSDMEDLPDEIWLLVIHSLSMSTLSDLLDVSRRLCRLSADVMLLRDERQSLDVLSLRDENRQSDIDRGYITLSASKLFVIPYIQTINQHLRRGTIVVRDDEDAEEMERRRSGRQFLARIPELRIRVSPDHSFLAKSHTFTLSRFIPELLQLRFPDVATGNYLVMRDGRFNVSVPRKTRRRQKDEDEMGHFVGRSHEDSFLHLLLALCTPKSCDKDFLILPIILPVAIILYPVVIPFKHKRRI
ncbi:hypothetical protein C8J56DRAFT_385130 [Mycena floridula]|nr:hypothetical protein C8J56DRAFT_385130 [Mycena floridula]